MEKFKDFIYDKNDILIAFIIMAFAALLIFWRLDVIMDYPEKILETSKETSASETVDKDTSDNENTSDKEDTSDKGTSDKDTSDKDSKDEVDGKNTDSKNTDDIQSNTPAPLWSGGQLTKDVTVVVQGASATEAINCLISAELFKDYSEYQSVCEEEGFNHEKVGSGTFTFEKGWTKAKVADTVNWS